MARLQENEDLHEALRDRVSLMLKMVDELLELRARVWVAELATQNPTNATRNAETGLRFRRAVSAH